MAVEGPVKLRLANSDQQQSTRRVAVYQQCCSNSHKSGRFNATSPAIAGTASGDSSLYGSTVPGCCQDLFLLRGKVPLLYASPLLPVGREGIEGCSLRWEQSVIDLHSMVASFAS